MRKEIMLNILHSPSKYPGEQVANAAFLAAELLEKGGTIAEDGTFTVATPVAPVAAEAEVDPTKFVPKATADTLFNYLCQLLELLDHDQWTNPRGVDFRVMPIFKNIKTVVLSNIVNNMKTGGLLRPVTLEEGETPENAALRLYGQDSREFFCVCAERFLAQMLAEAGSGNVQHLELVSVDEAQKVISDQQIGTVDAPAEGASNDAPQG